ncbi:HEAT repeat domain-containing protein [Cellulomonas cellasea]|uniref:PBS lyase n=2 Tax=Cellulomonas cellasea TaxID=43670 RepID=A0A0A0B4C4_9CELL|nr:HEAT repeat domain-containing protein [Cellulomonas cellasea]KGM01710.1 hypothetical protein Q760_17865 [Cellulomonas cellasea DSM 20118]GEA86993.1 hypothetical protein CCE01nite_09420 [Cellulomonas cellasea]
MDPAETHLTRLVEADEPNAVAAEVRAAVGERAALELAVSWGRASDPDVRCAALDLLVAVLDAAWEASPDVGPDAGTIRLVVEQAGSVSPDDEDEYLRWIAARALRLVAELDEDGRAIELLMRFADDEDGDVRLQVSYTLAFSLGDDAAPDDPAAEVLVRLLNDPDTDVRDFASFAFTICSMDSPVIRAELLTLCATTEEPAAGQAGAALADRGDVRVIPVALSKLAHDDVADLWVYGVARPLPDRALLPALLRLREGGWADRADVPGLTSGRTQLQEMLDDAITAARTA